MPSRSLRRDELVLGTIAATAGALAASGCDPTSNPGGFAAGMGLLTIGLPIVIVVITVVPIAFFVIRLMKNSAQNAQIVAQGEPATAVILQLSDTGTRINNNPQVIITMQIQRQGQQPYQAQTTTVVSELSIPRVQPGLTVPVKVDRMNPMQIALDLNRPVAIPGAMMPQQGMQPGMMPQQQPGMQPQQQPGMQPGMMPQPGMQPGMMPQQQPGMMPGSQPGQGQVVACPNCRQQVPPGSPACPYCGTQVQPG